MTLPVKDVNLSTSNATRPEQFESLLKAANPDSLEQSEKVSKREQNLYKADRPRLYGQATDDRQYEIKGIQRGDTQLKATIKASADVAEGNLPFELSTIDLYSSRSRVWFGKLYAPTCSGPQEDADQRGRGQDPEAWWKTGKPKARRDQTAGERAHQGGKGRGPAAVKERGYVLMRSWPIWRPSASPEKQTNKLVGIPGGRLQENSTNRYRC